MSKLNSNVLIWNADYALGYAGIDAEHKEIFDLLKALWSADPPSKEEAWVIVTTHLTEQNRHEEEIMYLYLTEDQISEHQEDHHRLQNGLMFERPNSKARITMSDEEIELLYRVHIVDFVQNLLIPHIHKYDALLASQMKLTQ